MTLMAHEYLASAVRLVVSACGCQSAAERRYRALAGEKGMVECQDRGDIVAVLPCMPHHARGTCVCPVVHCRGCHASWVDSGPA